MFVLCRTRCCTYKLQRLYQNIGIYNRIQVWDNVQVKQRSFAIEQFRPTCQAKHKSSSYLKNN